MIAIAHLETFFRNAPLTFGDTANELLATARKMLESPDFPILYSAQVRELIPAHADDLFYLVENRPEYIDISVRHAHLMSPVAALD